MESPYDLGMGMTSCKDCGEQRSDQKGSVCPHCGNVMKSEGSSRGQDDVDTLFWLVMGFCGICYAIYYFFFS